MNAKPSKYHHYVPQGYLKNFLNPDTNSLYVLDKQTGEIRSSATRSVCAENHYNTIFDNEFPPDSVEKLYAQFESRILYGLNTALCSGEEPTSVQWNDILNLASFLFANSPRKRKTYEIAKAHEGKVLDGLSKAGIGEYVSGDFFDANKSRAEMISLTLSIHDEILPLLGRRHWSFIECAAPEISFLTSDNPVYLGKKEGRESPYFGVGSLQTEVIFPLSPKICIYGSFEEDADPRMFATDEIVRSINERIYDRAMRIVISNSSNFLQNIKKVKTQDEQ